MNIFYSIIGWLYLRIRHGKNYKKIAWDEYLGQYEMAGLKIVLKSFLFMLIILIGALLAVVLIRGMYDAVT